MLRNLNRSSARGRICGTPHSGVKGGLIPSSGTDGAAILYPSLTLPDDSSKEYRVKIKEWPLGLSLFVFEDSSFIASSATDGQYVIPYDQEEDGVYIGSGTLTLNFGVNSYTLNTLPLSVNVVPPPVYTLSHRQVVGQAAQYTLTGSNVDVVLHTAISTYTLSATTASISLTQGQVSLLMSRRLVASADSIQVLPVTAVLRYVQTGTYTLNPSRTLVVPRSSRVYTVG